MFIFFECNAVWHILSFNGYVFDLLVKVHIRSIFAVSYLTFCSNQKKCFTFVS